MNINQQISELQERNRVELNKKTGMVTMDFHDTINKLTTNTAHAVALAVIGEIRKVPYGTNGNGQKWVMMKDLEDHLSTLEAALQDNK